MVWPRLRHVATRPLLVLWAILIVAGALFLAFGTVRIGAGRWAGLRMSVRRIWENFTQYLVDQGATGAIVIGVTAAAILALVGVSLLLWLACDTKDVPSDVHEENAGQ